MAKFNPADYEMVEDRLAKFWKDNPNGRVYTEVVKTSDDGMMVIVKAYIYADKEDINPVATGIAQELQGQGGFANTDAWMENCETSAIGRALANWKYQGSTKKRPSLQEMSKTQGQTKVAQSKPATPKKEKDEAQEDGKKATPPSSTSPECVRALLKEAGFDHTSKSTHEKTGEIAVNDTDLLCTCGLIVQYIKPQEKKTPKSPDFRCTGASKCTTGDTVDGKVFSKSWWTDGWNTPEMWKDYAAAANGIKLPDAKTIEDGAAPF